jgi:hypothetical protein
MTSRDDQWRAVLRLMPPEVRKAIPNNRWSRDALWALRLPTEEIPVADLRWVFDLPLWADGNVPFQVTPSEVQLNPNRYAEQYQRTLAADLDYPIHLIMHTGRWTILDGVHRLLKAQMIGRTHVLVMKLSDEHFKSIFDLECGP